MPRHRIYVETTIPSFYFETRPQPDMVARREWTRRWWGLAREEHELVTSAAVIDELSGGEYASRGQCLELTRSLPALPVNREIIEIAEIYARRLVMPMNPLGDAMHLAIASYHRCEFLVTWNCVHLANGNKFVHIRRVNALLDLFVPSLVTPLELLGEHLDGP